MEVIPSFGDFVLFRFVSAWFHHCWRTMENSGCQVSIRFTFLDFRLKNASGATEKLLRCQSEGSCLVFFLRDHGDLGPIFWGESNARK